MGKAGKKLKGKVWGKLETFHALACIKTDMILGRGGGVRMYASENGDILKLLVT